MFKDNGSERIQSSWSTWLLLEGNNGTGYEYGILDNSLLVMCKTPTNYVYHTMDLTKYVETSFIDTTIGGIELSYTSSIKLNDWYPHLQDIGTPLDKILIKKVSIEGNGSFSADVYRSDYDTTYTKSYDDTSIQDLDIHVNSRVGTCDISIYDNTTDDFKIKSVVMEGLYTPSSKATK
jgi:hypothetical protein